jgi:hypothetical protein
MELFTFKTESVNYQRATNFEIICNSINFLNEGTVKAYINNTVLLPGEFYNVSGNYGEIHQQQYFISFFGENGGNLLVTTKVYTGLVDSKQLF